MPLSSIERIVLMMRYRLSLLLVVLLFVPALVRAQGECRSEEERSALDSIIYKAPARKILFYADYKKNRESIRALSQLINTFRTAIEAGDVKVRVLGFHSSCDTISKKLSEVKNWSNQIKSYYIVTDGLKEEHFKTTNTVRPWRNSDDLVAITYLFNTAGSPDSPLDMEAVRARTAVITPLYNPEKISLALCDTTFAPLSHRLSCVPSPLFSETKTPARRYAGTYRPLFAIKTNIAYWAVAVANLGVELALGERYTLDVPFVYSPYTVATDFRFRFMTVQPEFRYWLKNQFKGHFLGAHLHAGVFNVSVDKKTRYQSPKGFYGMGLSYGYSLALPRHWALEFTIGAGYVYTRYDVYYNIPNGARYKKDIPYHYWGITRAGIGLVYTLGQQK